MHRLVDVKFLTNIANRWLFMIQRNIFAVILYSQNYFDMFGLFGGGFGHGVLGLLKSLGKLKRKKRSNPHFFIQQIK